MRTHYKKCTGTGLTRLETPHNKTEVTTGPGTNNNGAISPLSSTAQSDVTIVSAQSLPPPAHSEELSCGSSVVARNAVQSLPA